MTKPTVCVLMSTYNGEKYLREQLDSILNQKGEFHLQLLVRDDGSKDSTRDILLEYASRYDNVSWYGTGNLGAAHSFLQLVYDAPKADFYAFADQDDFWLPDKINHGIVSIESDGSAVLYGTAKTIVDKDLHPTGKEDLRPQSGILNMLFKWNKVSGCTMIFNKQMKDLLQRYRCTVTTIPGCHDSWAYKLAILYGKVIYDNNSYILYRQHENNVVGALKSSDEILKAKLDKVKTFKFYRFDKVKNSISARKNSGAVLYARNILATEDGHLQEQDRKILDCIAYGNDNLWKRTRLFFTPGLSMNPLWEYISIKMKILLGWF